MDEAVSICLLKRFSADKGTDSPPPVMVAETGHSVAVIGAGPAGLAAAFYSRKRGHHVVVYEKENVAGGAVRNSIPESVLPKNVLDAEISLLLETGINMHYSSPVNKKIFNELKKKFDAVVVACALPEKVAEEWGLVYNGTGVEAEKGSYRCGNENVFAIGSALRPLKLAVRSQGQGKEVAFSIDQLIKGEEVRGEPQRFNSRFGKLLSDELSEYMKEADGSGRRIPELGINAGFTEEEAVAEAKRCMRCDCREKENCLLRDYADQYSAGQKHFSGQDRWHVKKIMTHREVIYEPSKCIKCGICVRLAEKEKEKFGFTFIGRGFDVVVSVPFNKSLEEALSRIAGQVVKGCPTGALTVINKA